jgi:hypothetical protein
LVVIDSRSKGDVAFAASRRAISVHGLVVEPQSSCERYSAAAQSTGASSAEQEKLRVNAQLVAAAMKDSLSREAAEAKAQMSGLGDAAAVAAQALAKPKVATEIKFGGNTALLSQDDVQIAQQLKGIYPDVATALGSVEAQGLKVNNALKGLSSSVESALTNDLTDLASGAKTAGNAFSDMANRSSRPSSR